MDNQDNSSSSNNQTAAGTQNPPSSSNTIPSDSPLSSTTPLPATSTSSAPSASSFPTPAPSEPISIGPLESQPVVIPASGEKLPKWFYILFVLVVIAFITLTVLLIFNFLQKGKPGENLSPLGNITVTSQPTAQLIEPTVTPEATDSALLKLGSLTASDELDDLETEVDETVLTFIDEDLEALDKDLTVTPP